MATHYSPSTSTSTYSYAYTNRAGSTCTGTSPSSLSLHDFDSEEFEEPAMKQEVTMTGAEDVNHAMSNVLSVLGRITEHLRENDANEAANSIAKSTHHILSSLSDATATWDIEKSIMKAVPVQAGDGLPALRGTSKKFQAGSWAAVAAIPTTDGNRLVKFKPSDALKRQATEDPTPVDPATMRVVWIKPWNPATRGFSDITACIDHGPLLSMAYSPDDDAVCVIFIHAQDARAFVQLDQQHLTINSYGVFGPGVEVLDGQPYPVDEHFLHERRRLTFARAKLFAIGEGITEDQFKRHIFSLVGEHNVELIWLFNSGNATVVFSSTSMARLVMNEFHKLRRQNGPYRDISVSFSHDPCEKPLNLITQMPGSRNAVQPNVHDVRARQVSGLVEGQPNGHSYWPYHPRTGSEQSSRHQGSTSADNDGWQTVGKRR